MNTVWEWRDAPKADFAVIGDPIHHSLSPRMHMTAYAALGLTRQYLAVHVPVGEVGEALERLRELGYRGVNVTVPHKHEAWQWAIVSDPLSKRIEAANTFDLQTRRCINTDAPGFMDTLKGFDFGDRNALILGAGGSAKAIVAAMTEAGWNLQIYNRTAIRAQELAAEFGCKAVPEPDLSRASLVVNTTSAALKGDDLQIDWSGSGPDLVAYDLMYGKPTRFLQGAMQRGLRTLDGLELLVAQGALAFEWWLGTTAPRDAMREALQ